MEMDTPITRKAHGEASTATSRKNSRWIASYSTHTTVASSNSISTSADRSSNLPWPKLCVTSAGRAEIPTAANVVSDEIRSSPECALSARIARLPVEIATTTLNKVRPAPATTEYKAT